MNKICWKGRAFKALSYGKNSKKAGRNFSGSITIFHRGGGAKRLLRRIDFQRKNLARGFIERIEYDPNRTARIALVRWSNIKLNDSVDNPERAGGIAGYEALCVATPLKCPKGALRGGSTPSWAAKQHFFRPEVHPKGGGTTVPFTGATTMAISFSDQDYENRAKFARPSGPVAFQSLPDRLQESVLRKPEAGPKLFSVDGAHRKLSRLLSYSQFEQILLGSEADLGARHGSTAAQQARSEAAALGRRSGSPQRPEVRHRAVEPGSQCTRRALVTQSAFGALSGGPFGALLAHRRFAYQPKRSSTRPDSDKGPPFRRSINRRTLGEPVAGRLKQFSVSRREQPVPGRQHFEARPPSDPTDSIGRQPPEVHPKGGEVHPKGPPRFPADFGGKKSSLGVDKVETAFSYILASEKLKSGDEVLNIDTGALRLSMTGNRFIAAPGPTLGATMEPGLGVAGSRPLFISTANLCQKSGISLPLWLAPIGSVIHNIELYPGGGGKLARAAGTSAQLVKKEPARGAAGDEVRCVSSAKRFGKPPEPRESGATLLLSKPAGLTAPPAAGTGFVPESTEAHRPQSASLCTIRLPSGQQQLLDLRCRATIGVVSNIDHRARILTKAGQRRWLGFRPVVRGVAMNPIDHPHGGGEGRTKGGRPSVSPWGKPTKAGFRGSRKGRRKL